MTALTGTSIEPTSGVFGQDRVHRLPVRVYYEDTDFTGIVYHARYLHFFERGRTDSLRSLGVRHADLAAQDDPSAFAVRHMEIDFIQAARVDDSLVVETRYRPQRGPRLMMEQTILRGEEKIAWAMVTAVCISMQGKVRRPPKWMVAAWDPMVIAD